MSLAEQSLLHNLSVNDKGKLIWNSSYDSLQKFVEEVLNLPIGEWSSPGGDAKLFESEGVSIRWYAKAKTITINGRDKDQIEEKLNSVASIAKRLAEASNRNSDIDRAVVNPSISLAKMNNKPDRNDESLEKYMQSLENRLQAISEESAADMSTVRNTLLKHSNELKQIKNHDPASELITLRRENLELKNENKNLIDRLNNLSYILADLQGKAKAAEDEKASLITSIRLLCNDLGINQPSNVNCLVEQNRPSETNSEADSCQLHYNIPTQNRGGAHSTEEVSKKGFEYHPNKQKRLKEKSINQDRDAEPAVNRHDDQADQSINIPIHNRFATLRVEEDSEHGVESLNNASAQTNQNCANIHQQKENHSEDKPTIVIIGDSMVKNINPRKLSRRRVNKFTFPGKRAEEITSEVKNINVQPQPAHVIIHAGTNNLPTDTSEECIKNIKGLCSSVKERFPNAKLGVSSIILRRDIEVIGKMHQVNEDLKRLCNESGFAFIDNSIIDESGLNNSKLHLSTKGSALLATRFIKFINPDKQINYQSVGNHSFSENFLRDLLNLVALTQTSTSQRRRTR